MPPIAQENRRPAPPRCLSRSQRKLIFFFLKCIIMMVVIALFLFFLGFAAIVLLYFLFISNRFNRRCVRLFHHTNAPTEAAAASAYQDLPLLPDVAYTVASFSWTSDCAICLESFQEGDECRNIPVCRHLFHAKCLDRWIRKKPTCPVCRTRVDLNPSGLPGSRTRGDDQWKRLWSVNLDEGTSY